MTDAACIPDPADAVLARIAELDLLLAERLHALAMAAEPATLGPLVRDYRGCTRSLRQTLALRARLARERRLAHRADLARADRRQAARRHDHKTQVRLAVDRLIWTEAEGQEAERLSSELEDILELAAFDAGFLETRIEDHIHAACLELELQPPPPGSSAMTRPADAAGPEPEDRNQRDAEGAATGAPLDDGRRRSSA